MLSYVVYEIHIAQQVHSKISLENPYWKGYEFSQLGSTTLN